MHRLLIALAALICAAPVCAQAGVVVTVDKTAQRLTVAVDGATRYQWPVSTARWGYRTPNGSYRPQRLARKWFSRRYDWSPMPHSIFFNGGYAIHGSYEVSHLGRPASHGCIRLHPRNAAILFDLVKRRTADTRIVVIGGGAERAAQRKPALAPAYIVSQPPPRELTGIDAGPEIRRPGPGTFERIFTEPPRYRASSPTLRRPPSADWR